MLHNISHFLVPIIVVRVVMSFAQLDLYKLIFSATLGAFFPDIDHFTMRKTYKNVSFWKFIKEVMKAERYRKGFLFFHNLLTILFLIVLIPITARFFSIYFSIFLLSFLAHLIMDFLADVLIIKSHAHWKFKKWI